MSAVSRVLFFYLLICESTDLISAVPLNGEKVDIAGLNEFPFIASLQTKVPHNDRGEKHFCTGTLITRKDVITAGHCIKNVSHANVYVILGAIDISSANNSKYDVQWWITYDQWANHFGILKQFDTNDIAILRLSTSVLQTNVKPAILTELVTPQLYRTKAIIAGWGVTTEGGLTNFLRKAFVDVYTLEACERQLFLISNRVDVSLGRNELCTAAKPYVLTSCVCDYFRCGDSGGPLLDRNNNLIGVATGSCVNKSFYWGDFPAEFIKKHEINLHFSVDYYREFIHLVTNAF